jgi:hypothetical protein
MGRILLLVLLASFLSAAGPLSAQYCSMNTAFPRNFRNPLEERLSAYDIKHYALSLSVSNLDTKISGEASILMEARRRIDTVLLELQDALTVSEIWIGEQEGPHGLDPVPGYVHEGDVLTVRLDRTRQATAAFFRASLTERMTDMDLRLPTPSQNPSMPGTGSLRSRCWRTRSTV